MKTNSLMDVFNEAMDDYATTKVNDTGYKAGIFLGVKITKDDTTDEIKIYDPEESINYYVEIQGNVYSLFHSKGWKVAVIELTLKKYKERLERIKDSISREMNNNQSPKRLRMLTESRQQILRKYYKLTQKLN